MRSIVISISDGLLPSRNGLGGFLKYLILKCLSLAKNEFKAKDESEFLACLVPVVIDTLKSAYPELSTKTNYIQVDLFINKICMQILIHLRLLKKSKSSSIQTQCKKENSSHGHK